MLLLDTTVGFHWFDLLTPLVYLLILVGTGAVVWGVVFFFVHLFREMRRD